MMKTRFFKLKQQCNNEHNYQIKVFEIGNIM